MKSKSKITKNIDWRLDSTGKPSKALINLLSSGNRILEKKEFDEMKKPGSPYNKVAKELSQKRKIWRKKVIDSFSKKKFRDSTTIRRYMYEDSHLYDISKLIGEKLGQKDAALLMRVAKVIRPKKKKTVKPKKKKTVKKTKSFKKKFEELEDELEDAYQKGDQDIIEEIEKDLKKLVKKKKTSKTKK